MENLSPKYEIRNVDPHQLIPWERNPRRHNMPALRQSIERFGFRNVIVVNERTNTIEAGHGRAQAAIDLGIQTVPVLFVDDDDATATAYAIADNRQTEIGGWDESALVPLLQELQAQGDDALVGLGYTDVDIAALVRRVTPTTETVAGRTIESKYEIYQQNAIRQIVLYYASEQYEHMLTRMRDIMDANDLESNSEVLVWLMERYEASSG
jgi:hypothetical protein